MHAHLATDATALVASKWGLCMHAVTGIDRKYTCTHAFCYADSPAKVARPYRSRQAIHCVVGQPDCLLLGIEWNDAYNRPENLFLAT